MTTYEIESIIRNGNEYCFGGGGGVRYGHIEFLAIGGGGGGGFTNYGSGGGGGGGGFIECDNFVINNQDICHSVVVGNGGSYNSKGGNSCIDGIIAYGGGNGGCSCACGGNGGSGGGGGLCGYQGGTGCSGQGNDGACGCYNTYDGGGGGAGAPGSNCTGGDGKCSCITGELCWYSGGGGGGYPGGNGGCGGGGNGGCPGCSGTYYGGGGGGSRGNTLPGSGCQGVVIIRYKTDGSCGIKPDSSGGTKYTCGDYTIHCFCTVGTDYFIPVFK